MTPAIPTHTKNAIERKLGAPMRHAHGTFAPHRCHCGTWTLQGLSALLTHLDPTPLSTDLERAALILGRWTYELHGTPGHFEVTARASPYAPIWANPPAPGDDCVVVPTHVCNKPLLAPAIPITQPKNPGYGRKYDDDAEIPF